MVSPFWRVLPYCQVIMPADLEGALFSDSLQTLHLHLAFPDNFKAALGPSRYDHIIRMATGEWCLLESG